MQAYRKFTDEDGKEIYIFIDKIEYFEANIRKNDKRPHTVVKLQSGTKVYLTISVEGFIQELQKDTMEAKYIDSLKKEIAKLQERLNFQKGIKTIDTINTDKKDIDKINTKKTTKKE